MRRVFFLLEEVLFKVHAFPPGNGGTRTNPIEKKFQLLLRLLYIVFLGDKCGIRPVEYERWLNLSVGNVRWCAITRGNGNFHIRTVLLNKDG